MNLKLVFPTEEHREMWTDIISELEKVNEKIVPYALTYGKNDYDEFLRTTEDFYNNKNIPSHWVQASTYFLMVKSQSKILGTVNIRHWLNEGLLLNGGHIGYGVHPKERKKGYATKMLSLALEKCRELGLIKVLVTCDKNNIGSAKTIINNGGALENEIVEDNGKIIQRYWIEL